MDKSCFVHRWGNGTNLIENGAKWPENQGIEIKYILWIARSLLHISNLETSKNFINNVDEVCTDFGIGTIENEGVKNVIKSNHMHESSSLGLKNWAKIRVIFY